MKVRLRKPVGYRKVGSELTVGDGVGELWIQQGKAERVESAPVEAMVPAKPTRGNRGQPRRAGGKSKPEKVTMS